MVCGCYSRIEPTYNKDEQTSRAPSPCEETSDNDTCCNCCKRLPFWVLPIVSTIWNLLGIFISFGISVSKDHYDVEDVPYISHTAVYEPQMYIFSQFLNMGAVMILFIGIIRLLYVKETLSSTQTRVLLCRWSCFNTFTFVVGLTCAFGFTLVANFPTDTAKQGHYLGGVLGFVGGAGYCILQAVLSYRMYREKGTSYPKCAVISQIVISTVLICLLVMLVVLFLGISYFSYPNDVYYTSTEFKISSVAEWSYIVTLNIYMLTFIPEFRRIEFKSSLIDIHS